MFSRRAASEFPNDNPELHDGLVWACPAPLGRALPTLRLRPFSGALPRVLGPSWETPAEVHAEDAAVPSSTPLAARAAPEADAESIEAVTEPEPEAHVESIEAVAEPEPEAHVESIEAVAEPEPEAHVESVEAVAQLEPPCATAEPDTAPTNGPFAEFVTVLARITLGRGATRSAAALTALCEHGRVATGAFDDAALRALVAGRVVAPSGTHATAEFRATLDAWRGVLEGTATDLTACGATTLDTWAAELLAATLNAPSGDVPELRRELRRAGVAAFGLLAVA